MHVRAAPGSMLGWNDIVAYAEERMTDGKIMNFIHVTFHECSLPKLAIQTRAAEDERQNTQLRRTSIRTAMGLYNSKREVLSPETSD